ncbi:hypothetical protein Tcan_01375 [Toxocara canis]|uniref:Uncharacterized protein n=1 Tax=Toxocara canis TaxID=6265 RepID=A0A0B2VXD7_TOXCA|nr:hypothetical protein Tcan_01375 [Toxocara canis]
MLTFALFSTEDGGQPINNAQGAESRDPAVPEHQIRHETDKTGSSPSLLQPEVNAAFTKKNPLHLAFAAEDGTGEGVLFRGQEMQRFQTQFVDISSATPTSVGTKEEESGTLRIHPVATWPRLGSPNRVSIPMPNRKHNLHGVFHNAEPSSLFAHRTPAETICCSIHTGTGTLHQIEGAPHSEAADLPSDFPTGPNDALEQHWHPLLTPGDTFTKLNGGCFFCQINLFEAHLQLEMDGKSWSLLTINTRRELYRYNRLQEWATTLLNYDSTVE